MERDKKEKNVIICRCEEVTLGDIEAAIADGAASVTGIKKRTRAGMGLCQGKTCQRLVQRILSEKTGVPLRDVLPSTVRSPVRPIRMGIMEEREDE